MLTEDEARTVYDELIKKLRAIEAVDLLSQISTAVGVGRVQLRERDHIQGKREAVAHGLRAAPCVSALCPLR